ncbi:hypothetical protein GCM10020255_033660 [Rhodococcus baikonurensis]
MGIGSPYLSKLDLERYGLIWRWAEVDCAHPLDNGDAGVLYRSLEQTAAGLGADGPRWQRMFEDLSTGFDALASDLMRPIVNVPRHPLRLAAFGPRALLPATVTAKLWKTDKGKALFGGVAAHAFYPLNRPATSAVGLMITAAGHRYGWPVAEGGSRSITDAMAAMLLDHGGKIDTGVRIRTASEIPDADVVLLDVNPGCARNPGRSTPGPSGEGLSKVQAGSRSIQGRFCDRRSCTVDQSGLRSGRNCPSGRWFRRNRGS